MVQAAGVLCSFPVHSGSKIIFVIFTMMLDKVTKQIHTLPVN